MKQFNWANKVVLITGGTGSFGRAFVGYLLGKRTPPTVRVFSRDEFKQYQMMQEFKNHHQLRFMLGDVREVDRLRRALQGVDVVIHAAALKQIPLGEYNPFEPVKTNILGTRNVIEAALDSGVSKAILISSDKAAYPINLYGATKLCAEKLFIQGNVYAGKRKGIFSVVRYGNVLGSRGSVLPMFLEQKTKGQLTVTSKDMTRFWITLPQACKFVDGCVGTMRGGELFIPKLPSIRIVDLARAIAPGASIKEVGIRPGEKMHEVLITQEESRRAKKFPGQFVISPEFPFWQDRAPKKFTNKHDFIYASDTNSTFLSIPKIKTLLHTLALT